MSEQIKDPSTEASKDATVQTSEAQPKDPVEIKKTDPEVQTQEAGNQAQSDPAQSAEDFATALEEKISGIQAPEVDEQSIVQGVFELNELKGVASQLESTNKEQKSRLDFMEAALKARNEVDFATLSEEDRGLIQELGGEDPVKQLMTFTALKKAGRIGKTHVKPVGTDQTRTSSGRMAESKPTSLEDARKSAANRLRQIRAI